jgi:hypothetical protein
MKRFSQIFLIITILLVLAWQLPWLYSFLSPKTSSTPFALYSTISGDFVTMGNEEKGFVRKDLAGNEYTQEEIDSLLPFFYVRQLMTDERFPDTINGVAISPKEVQITNFTFRSSPRDINVNPVGLYPLLESESGRVDLKMPDDVFRITDKGIEFVKMESNTVDKAKSDKFTNAMLKKGFVFPATVIAGNPSARKDYDEGYLIADKEGKLFHVKQVVGRPYVRFIDKDASIVPVQAYVAEFRDRRILGFLCDTVGDFYVLTKDYVLNKTAIKGFDPKKEAMTIIGNVLDWTVKISDAQKDKIYAIDADDYSLIKEVTFENGEKPSQILHFTSTTDKLVKPRLF